MPLSVFWSTHLCHLDHVPLQNWLLNLLGLLQNEKYGTSGSKSMLHFCIWLHLWSTGSNIKLLRISSWQQQSIKLSVGSFQSWTPVPALVTCLFLTFMVHHDLFSLLLMDLTWATYYVILDLPWSCFAATRWLLFTQLLWVAIQMLIDIWSCPKSP